MKTEKEIQREKIEKDTKDFINRGGIIKQVKAQDNYGSKLGKKLTRDQAHALHKKFTVYGK